MPPGARVSPSADVVAGEREGSEEEQDHDDGQCHVLLAEGLPDELRVHAPHSGEAHVTPEGERHSQSGVTPQQLTQHPMLLACCFLRDETIKMQLKPTWS